jgi:hypothetical protein
MERVLYRLPPGDGQVKELRERINLITRAAEEFQHPTSDRRPARRGLTSQQLQRFLQVISPMYRDNPFQRTVRFRNWVLLVLLLAFGFRRIFPGKVDLAERKPTTWNWMVARIRDGNNVKPPRNLIDLATMARDEQLKAEARTPRQFGSGEPLITADAIRKALEKLSVQRVEDTLLAEAGPQLSPLIQKFRGMKAEQNMDILENTLGLRGEDLNHVTRQLGEIGFLEEAKASWKVPMLYRAGLEITQGKAFVSGPSESAETDDE